MFMQWIKESSHFLTVTVQYIFLIRTVLRIKGWLLVIALALTETFLGKLGPVVILQFLHQTHPFPLFLSFPQTLLLITPCHLFLLQLGCNKIYFTTPFAFHISPTFNYYKQCCSGSAPISQGTRVGLRVAFFNYLCSGHSKIYYHHKTEAIEYLNFT